MDGATPPYRTPNNQGSAPIPTMGGSGTGGSGRSPGSDSRSDRRMSSPSLRGRSSSMGSSPVTAASPGKRRDMDVVKLYAKN